MHLSSAAITATGLHKAYGSLDVVRGIDFSVPVGQCFGLLGPNGAGKTSTLRMILGLSPPSAGQLRVFGLPMPQAASQIRQRIGVVPQMDNLDPDFTVAENLYVYGRYFGINRDALDVKVPQLLDFVSLQDKANSPIETLSGGMKRRLTIARALINDPELLILDEPTTGLDPQARHLIWARLRDLLQQGKTLLLTTHYMEEAERLCDRLLILEHGRVLAEGAPAELVATYAAASLVEIRARDPSACALQLADLPNCTMERHGDTWYCQAADPKLLLERLATLPGITYLHRPANLEDVFLRLTGRDLRE